MSARASPFLIPPTVCFCNHFPEVDKIVGQVTSAVSTPPDPVFVRAVQTTRMRETIQDRQSNAARGKIWRRAAVVLCSRKCAGAVPWTPSRLCRPPAAAVSCTHAIRFCPDHLQQQAVDNWTRTRVESDKTAASFSGEQE